VVYDKTADDTSLSHLAYSLFTQGKAVCDGYTGAYNLLLKLEGIDCHAYVQDDHIWTVATLDGTEYHIDTTWGDSGNDINYVFFAMTPAQSLLYHK
jgi:transglutaminase/protease-like cytokinesis protein 3